MPDADGRTSNEVLDRAVLQASAASGSSPKTACSFAPSMSAAADPFALKAPRSSLQRVDVLVVSSHRLKKMGFVIYGDDATPIIPLMLYNPAKIPYASAILPAVIVLTRGLTTSIDRCTVCSHQRQGVQPRVLQARPGGGRGRLPGDAHHHLARALLHLGRAHARGPRRRARQGAWAVRSVSALARPRAHNTILASIASHRFRKWATSCSSRSARTKQLMPTTPLPTPRAVSQRKPRHCLKNVCNLIY